MAALSIRWSRSYEIGMTPLSMDLRTRIVALLDKGWTPGELAELLQVGCSTIKKLRQRRLLLGHIRWFSPPGRPRKTDAAQDEALVEVVADHPDATLQELSDFAQEELSVTISRSTVDERLKQRGITRKKKASVRARPTDPTSLKSGRFTKRLAATGALKA